MICRGCQNEIDPECCHCGDWRTRHNDWDTGHSFVPMGCTCGYDEKPMNEYDETGTPIRRCSAAGAHGIPCEARAVYIATERGSRLQWFACEEHQFHDKATYESYREWFKREILDAPAREREQLRERMANGASRTMDDKTFAASMRRLRAP